MSRIKLLSLFIMCLLLVSAVTSALVFFSHNIIKTHYALGELLEVAAAEPIGSGLNATAQAASRPVSYARVQHNPDESESQPTPSTTPSSLDTSATQTLKLTVPTEGMYFGAFPEFGPYEDDVTLGKVETFQRLVGKDIAWAYFSNNWFGGIEFPHEAVAAITAAEVTPYIRLMPRIDFRRRPGNMPYRLEQIAAGEYDADLRQWAIDAKATDVPLMVEFGTEVNGDWFPWNGRWNGGGETEGYGDETIADGPERFIAAYRRVIDVFNEAGATNVTWVYHVNATSAPEQPWNDVMAYYPGDEYIDWIGISVYGAYTTDEPWTSFDDMYGPAYRTITAATDKPIAIVEMGLGEGVNKDAKARWLTAALRNLANGVYPRTKGVSYWHSLFEDDGEIINLRLDSSDRSLTSFSQEIVGEHFLSQAQFQAATLE